MKRFLAALSMVLIMLNSFGAHAMVHNDYTNGENAEGIIFTEGSSLANVEFLNDRLVLNATVENETEKTGAYYLSPLIDIGNYDNIYSFSCEIEVEATEDLTANRYIQLAYGNTSSIDSVETINLINITKNRVRVGSSNKSVVLTNNGEHIISGLINTGAGTFTVYLDGSVLAENQNLTISSEFDIESARLMFSNYFTPTGAAAYSKFIIKSYMAASYNSDDGPLVTTTVDDFGSVSAENLANGFYINFGTGLVSEPDISLYENYGTTNERKIESKTGYNGYMINICPKGESFLDAKNYTVVVENILYIGEEPITEKVFHFTTIDSNYVRPQIEIIYPEDNAVYFEGETITVKANITPGSESVEKTELYIDGTPIGELDEKGEYEWTGQTKGTYVIKVVATDALGVACEDYLSVLVNENEPPFVWFDKGNNAMLASTDKVLISADDNDGEIEYIEIYVDGVLWETAYADSFELGMNSVANGYHNLLAIAYDNRGATAEATVDIAVTEYAYKEYVNQDFEKFTESVKSFTGCNLNYTNGYIKPVVIDDKHGTSFMIGAETTGTANTWFQVNANKEYNITRAVLEFDIYMENTRMGSSMRGNTLQAPDATTAVAVYPISITNQVSNGNESMPIEDNKWYHARYYVDTVNHTHSFTVTGDGGSITWDRDLTPELARVSSEIRMEFVKSDKSLPGYSVVLDNITFRKISELPVVESIVDSEQNTMVKYDSEYICVKMSGNMKTVTTDDIMLYNNNGAQNVSKVIIDENNSSVMYVYPEGEFLSGDEYTLKILKTAVCEAGTYENDTTATFKTTAKPFDVIGGQITKSKNKIDFELDFSNDNTQNKDCVMLLSLYKNGVFERIVHKNVSVPYGTCTGSISVNVASDDYTAYGLVIDGDHNMIPVSNKLFVNK